jgi:hypothetical protein
VVGDYYYKSKQDTKYRKHTARQQTGNRQTTVTGNKEAEHVAKIRGCGPKTDGMVGLMWLKETGAKGNSEDVQNKCACGRWWNKCAIHGLALRARLVAWFWLSSVAQRYRSEHNHFRTAE